MIEFLFTGFSLLVIGYILVPPIDSFKKYIELQIHNERLNDFVD